MKLHKNKDLFKELIEITSQKYNIPEIYIEKDYWVTLVLKRLSESEYKNNVVFKGGTSLSKAYGIINRFSEDIDLQLIKNNNNSNQNKKLIKKIENEISKDLKIIKDHDRERKQGTIRKTVYEYEKTIYGDSSFGQISDKLILEINFFSSPDPYELLKIQSYIGEFLEKNSYIDEIAEYELESFKINILNKKRTFVEKIFAVMDFSFIENEEEKLAMENKEIDYKNLATKKLGNKVRHLYDIYKLMQDAEIISFFNSEEFFHMANKVVIENDFYNRRINFKYTNSIYYREMKYILNNIEKADYKVFEGMVFEDTPDMLEIGSEFIKILERIKIWEKDYRKDLANIVNQKRRN